MNYILAIALGAGLGLIVIWMASGPVVAYISRRHPGVTNSYKITRDQRLYKASHSDFYEYCKDRFGDTRAEVDLFIKASVLPDQNLIDTETILCPLDRSCVYFVLGAGLVKIGYSSNPVKRFRELQSMSPVKLELLGMIPGDNETEARIHRILYKFKKRGEWFVASTTLLSFVNYVCKFGFVDSPHLSDFIHKIKSPS